MSAGSVSRGVVCEQTDQSLHSMPHSPHPIARAARPSARHSRTHGPGHALPSRPSATPEASPHAGAGAVPRYACGPRASKKTASSSSRSGNVWLGPGPRSRQSAVSSQQSAVSSQATSMRAGHGRGDEATSVAQEARGCDGLEWDGRKRRKRVASGEDARTNREPHHERRVLVLGRSPARLLQTRL